jgi:mannose-6-phosphate isomerase-like protein (cupin superfamily)
MSATEDALQGREGIDYLRDPYLEWCAGEGVPIVGEFAVNLHEVKTAPWPRLGADAAFVHLDGRGDFMALFVLDLAPGGKTLPQRHVYEEVIYVLSGHGSTMVEVDGTRHTFEWGPNSLFALPLNTRYQHFNGSGREKARLISANSLPIMLNIFHDRDFIFANDALFPGRIGKPGYFDGEGEKIETQPGRFMWETNFVADVANFKLEGWEKRGGRSSNMRFALADGVVHVHTSEMAVGTYKKGHRHGADFHVLLLSGTGYSLFWFEGDKDFRRVDWAPGVVFAPVDNIFHQHFNTGPNPARYLPLALGSTRHPLTAAKKQITLGVDVDVKKGGNQIEYHDQDPRVHAMFMAELRKNGVRSLMGEYIDESGY